MISSNMFFYSVAGHFRLSILSIYHRELETFQTVETFVQRKIRTHLDLLSIPQLGRKKCQNV